MSSPLQSRNNLAGLFMLGFKGTTASKALLELIEEYPLAGVILFRQNIVSVEQLQQLISKLQQHAGGTLLVAVDHEGGRVFRLPAPFTLVPPMAKVGKYLQNHPDSDLAYQIGQMMAAELRAVGFNLNFAPVMDINTHASNPIIGDRSFGEEPLIVSQAGAEMIRGLQEALVAACAKHFPGHGDTSLDSHLALPLIHHGMERLREIELAPFQEAILNDVALIMSGHLKMDSIDPIHPVPFSNVIIQSLLRDEMGFNGVVITDDLCMGALRQQWTLDQRIILSLRAGCDIPLICHEPYNISELIQKVADAIDSGELDEGRMRDSMARINRLKERYVRAATGRLGDIGSPAHQAILSCLHTTSV